MKIHVRKLTAIMEVKGKALFSKNFIIMPVFALGFTYIMKMVYGTVGDIDMSGYILSLGVLMNICMTGIYLVAATLAEEKEKYTLRTLMTSSVNGLEFFLGSLLPVLLMTITVNVLCVFISGFVVKGIEQWLIYLLVTTVASMIGSIIGMIFGIFAKNQMSAGTMTTPALLVFMMIPMFSDFNETIAAISDFLFTGVIMNVISIQGISIDVKSIVILFVEIILSVIVFLILYKKNGYEAS